jgi:rubrerythrin
METVYTREAVIQLLHNILDFENCTLNLYEDYLNKLNDDKTVEVFKRLRDEEVQHVESIKQLLKALINFR